MTDQAKYGTTESWVSALVWTPHNTAIRMRAALLRGDVPVPYGLSLDEATAHWAACIDTYCPLAFMGWPAEPTPEPVDMRIAA